jgi:hypothetical protein
MLSSGKRLSLLVIGDFLLLFGLPSVLTSVIWFIQRISGRLSPSARYFRRRVFGFAFLLILFVIVFGLVVLVAAISSAPDGGNGATALGRRIGMVAFIELPIIYWWGLKTEDGFLRAVFVPYSSLTPQAKERLISGNLVTGNKLQE